MNVPTNANVLMVILHLDWQPPDPAGFTLQKHAGLDSLFTILPNIREATMSLISVDDDGFSTVNCPCDKTWSAVFRTVAYVFMCLARTVLLLCIVGRMFPFGAAACLCVRFFRGQAVIRTPQQPVALKRRLQALYLGERRCCCRCPLNRHLLSYRLLLCHLLFSMLLVSRSWLLHTSRVAFHQDTAGRCSVEPGVLQS